MPAPTPIQIRYGPSGLLGRAVAVAASNEARQGQDWQFVNSMAEQSNRSNAAMMDDALQSRRLQLAHSYRVSQEQNPGTAPAPAGDSGAGAALKNTYLTSAAADLPQDQAAQLKTLIGNPNVTPEQFRGVIFDATKKAKDKTDETAELEQRRNYVKAASQGLSPEDAASLASMAEDRKVSTGQLRTAADAIRGRNAVNQRHDTNLSVQGLDMQAHKAKSDMDLLARTLAKEGVDPNGPTAGLNPTYTDPSKGVNGFGGRIADKLVPGHNGSLVAGGQAPDTMARVIAYAKAKRQYDDLLAQREQLIQGGGQAAPARPGQAQAPAASGGSMSLSNESGWPVAENQGGGVSIASEGGVKQVTPEIAAQFLQLARGDKNAARQMAAQQGYSF